MQDEQARLDGWLAIMSVYLKHMKTFESSLRTHHDLTPPQFEILRNLADAPSGALRMSELGEAILYGSGATSNVVRRLELRGLVRRQADQRDARVVRVTLTESGTALISEVRWSHHALIASTLPSFNDEEERRTVMAFLQRAYGSTTPSVSFVPAPRTGA